MQKSQLSRLKKKLEDEQDELRNLSKATVSSRSPVELDQQSVGRLSRMDAIQQQSMDLAREVRRKTRRRVIEAALTRLNADDYGYCLTCGEGIAYERLEIDPALTRCFDCMED